MLNLLLFLIGYVLFIILGVSTLKFFVETLPDWWEKHRHNTKRRRLLEALAEVQSQYYNFQMSLPRTKEPWQIDGEEDPEVKVLSRKIQDLDLRIKEGRLIDELQKQELQARIANHG
ncbi:MAG: hypothetical protein WC757_02685 [Candidatus Paceibacterota bacterium]|jgi:hypothetical protein